jgi:hypothetical protein
VPTTVVDENGRGSMRLHPNPRRVAEARDPHRQSLGRGQHSHKDEGIDPDPKRGEGSWDEFVKRHAATLWASDFVSVRTMTLGGIVELYLLFFIHIGSSRVIVSHPTANPLSSPSVNRTGMRRGAALPTTLLGAPPDFGTTARGANLDQPLPRPPFR